MRVLFLTAAVEDFHQDLVLHGLVGLLGRENVLDFPQQERHASSPPPDHRYQPMGYLDLPPGHHAGQPIEDLALEADAVVVGALRGDAHDGLARLLQLGIDRPIAVLDGFDDPYVRAAIADADVYFKRETLASGRWLRMRMPVRRRYHALRRRPNDWQHPLRRQIAVATPGVEKLVPLPLGVIDRGFPPSDEKLYDVTFLGARTSSGARRRRRRAARLEGRGIPGQLPGRSGLESSTSGTSRPASPGWSTCGCSARRGSA